MCRSVKITQLPGAALRRRAVQQGESLQPSSYFQLQWAEETSGRVGPARGRQDQPPAPFNPPAPHTHTHIQRKKSGSSALELKDKMISVVVTKQHTVYTLKSQHGNKAVNDS